MRAGIVVNVTRADRLRLEWKLTNSRRTVSGRSNCRRTRSLSRSSGTSSVSMSILPPTPSFSVDEKSQIQALDRIQPGLPMKKGRAGTMTHDYKRHGTTTLLCKMLGYSRDSFYRFE